LRNNSFNYLSQDELDLGLVISQSTASSAASSLSEAQAIVAGRSSMSLLEEVIEIHHIGLFLELITLVESRSNRHS